MTKKLDKSDKMQRYSPIISMASAIIVAVLTGFISYRVAKVETDSQNLVAVIESKTQKMVASLKAETEKTIEFSMHNIEKARLFHKLIGELRDDKTGPLALLVLWRLYPEDEERKTTIVAAFEVKKPEIINSLIRLEEKEKWKDYLDTVKRLANSEDEKISELASNFWGTINTTHMGQYHVDNINRDEDSNAFSESVTYLIDLAKNSTSVKDLILRNSKASNDRIALFNYILYKAGKKDPFQSLLKERARDPDNFEEFNGVFCCGSYDPEETKQIADFAASFLRHNLGENLVLDITAFTVITQSYRENVKLNNEDSEFVINTSKEVFLDQSENQRVRFHALLALKNIDAKQALLAIAELMARGDVEMWLKFEVNNVLTGDRSGDPSIGDGLEVIFENYEIPNVEDKSTVWKDFLVKIQSENES